MSRKGTAISTTSTVVADSPSDDHSHDSLLKSLKDMTKGVSNKFDVSTVSAVLDFIENQHSLDDRKLLMEHVLALISRLPPSHFASGLNNKFIKLLYNDLPHPVTSFVGKGYAWRTADGSNNNIMLPDMGKAGLPYARSVQQANPLPPKDMPDAGLLFDTLLRRDKFVEHPAGCSSMMFSFAALVIHSVFRTSHSDSSINETSSYVDLSPLYGHNQEYQDKVRIRDGRGCIHPDTFAEDRLLLLPPAVCVILVLFSRNHNYIAKKLLEINERGTFVDPSTLDANDEKQKKKLMDQDEELFQVSRLINSNWFATVSRD
jgi:linoleate 10R-lipoxygenase